MTDFVSVFIHSTDVFHKVQKTQALEIIRPQTTTDFYFLNFNLFTLIIENLRNNLSLELEDDMI